MIRLTRLNHAAMVLNADLIEHIDVTPPMEGVSCVIDLDLGLGNGEARYLASDLSYEYVRLNAEYTT